MDQRLAILALSDSTGVLGTGCFIRKSYRLSELVALIHEVPGIDLRPSALSVSLAPSNFREYPVDRVQQALVPNHFCAARLDGTRDREAATRPQADPLLRIQYMIGTAGVSMASAIARLKPSIGCASTSWIEPKSTPERCWPTPSRTALPSRLPLGGGRGAKSHTPLMAEVPSKASQKCVVWIGNEWSATLPL